MKLANTLSVLKFVSGLWATGVGAWAATGFTVNGVDLDDIFEPIGGATPRATVGWVVNGADISQRYRPSVWGATDQIGYDTHYVSQGSDLRYLFRRKGYISPGGPSKTVFYFTGSNQTYTVPSGTQYLIVKVWGGGGGNGFLSTGGYGGFAQMSVTAAPGTVFNVIVGEAGTYEGGNTYGGGAGARLAGQGTGGGRSEVSDASRSIRLVAGGGGGSGDANGSGGSSAGGQGSGAGLAGTQGGSTGYGEGGGGGTLSGGGFSGNNSGIDYRDPAGTGAADVGGTWPWAVGQAPGGGGGGYYGGGGGGGNGAGGGGGSGVAVGGGNVVGQSNNNTADPDYVSPAGYPANHGCVVIIAFIATNP